MLPGEAYSSQSPVLTGSEQHTLERHSTEPTRTNEGYQPGCRTHESSIAVYPGIAETSRSIPVRQNTEDISNKSQPPDRQKTRLKAKVNSPLLRVLIVSQSRSERPRGVSVDPGIDRLPTHPSPADLEPIASEKKPYKEVSNDPPDHQYPAAPAHPLHKPLSGNKPDISTPSPRRKTESVSKKRGLFSWSIKPKDQSLAHKHSKTTELDRDTQFIRRFPPAVPVRQGIPGATLQRTGTCTGSPRQSHLVLLATQPSQCLFMLERMTTTPVMSTPPTSKDGYRRSRPAPTERAQRVFRNDACQQSLRDQASVCIEDQPRSRQALRKQEKTSSEFKAEPYSRRPPTHEASFRLDSIPRDETLTRPVRRDTGNTSEVRMKSYREDSRRPQVQVPRLISK
jgi:hypothetical protein